MPFSSSVSKVTSFKSFFSDYYNTNVKSIENAINSEFIKKNQSFKPIDWNRFLNDDAYAEEMIRQYDRVKHPVNILRVVRDNTGRVFVDLTGKANGRGAYLKRDLEVIKRAKKNKILDRRLEVEIPDSIYEELESMI